MARSSKVKLRLLVSDFSCGPEAISQILGIEPDATWKAGDKVHEQASNLHNENGWLLATPFGLETQPLTGQKNFIDALSNRQISPKIKDFRARAIKFDV